MSADHSAGGGHGGGHGGALEKFVQVAFGVLLIVIALKVLGILPANDSRQWSPVDSYGNHTSQPVHHNLPPGWDIER